MGNFISFLTKLSASNMIMAGYYRFTLFLFKRDLRPFGNKFFPLRVDLFYAEAWCAERQIGYKSFPFVKTAECIQSP